MHIQANMPEAAEGFAISGELFKPDARKRASAMWALIHDVYKSAGFAGVHIPHAFRICE